MDPDSEHLENWTDVEQGNAPKIIKTEDGNSVVITVDMVMPKTEQNSEDTSFDVMDKKPSLQKAIVQISPEEKCNAKTFEAKNKSVYFEGLNKDQKSSESKEQNV